MSGVIDRIRQERCRALARYEDQLYFDSINASTPERRQATVVRIQELGVYVYPRKSVKTPAPDERHRSKP